MSTIEILGWLILAQVPWSYILIGTWCFCPSNHWLTPDIPESKPEYLTKMPIIIGVDVGTWLQVAQKIA